MKQCKLEAIIKEKLKEAKKKEQNILPQFRIYFQIKIKPKVGISNQRSEALEWFADENILL